MELPPYYPQNDRIKGDFLDYAYEVEWFDKHLGLMLDKLAEIGELDNTLVVVTSDNGMPFPRVKGQMYEHDFRLPLAICWPERVPSDRVVDDLVSFIDFAPTFLEAAGVSAPAAMEGNSLLALLQSPHSGQVDPRRNRVFMGRERHDMGREGDVGYPVRCIRTEEYLYVRNFRPDRWPSGNPETGYTDVDSSPTKEVLLENHEHPEDYFYKLIFAKRPAEELYQIKEDPSCVHNLAGDSHYEGIKKRLWQELEDKLEKTGDPRVCGNGDVFDTYEYVGQARHSWKNYLEGRWQKQPY